MNIWSFFFGTKETVKQVQLTDVLPPPIPDATLNIDKYNHLDLTSSEPIKIADSKPEIKPPPLPKQEVVVKKEEPKYPFGESYSFESMSKLVKYWYDNMEYWEENFDGLEHGEIKNYISSLKSNVSYKNSNNFEFTFFPNNCNLWFKIKAESYGKIRCEAIHTSSYGRDKVRLEFNRFDTNSKVYKFFYDLTLNMKMTASDSFKLSQYCKKHNIPIDSKNKNSYKINDGEYYIHTTQFEHDARFMAIHDIRNQYYYSTCFYRFSDWSQIEKSYESFLEHFGENPKVELCDDPKTEFWQHFTKLEIEEKIKFMNNCKEFVNNVYADELEYSKLMTDAGMVNPYPKITCYSTMLTFCESINKKIPYKEHDINSAIAKLKEDAVIEIKEDKEEIND